MPDPLSVHEKFTPTDVLFQPKAFATGERLPVIPGDVLSRTYDAVPVPGAPGLVVQFWFLWAARFTVFVASPAPAMKANVHTWRGWLSDCEPLCAPVTTTHFVSLDVLTVSVSVVP